MSDNFVSKTQSTSINEEGKTLSDNLNEELTYTDLEPEKLLSSIHDANEDVLSANSGGYTNDPLFGEIRRVRYSIEKLFGETADALSSSNSSVVSSSSSTNSKTKSRKKKRTCIVWSTKPFIQVLLTSRFDGLNLDDPKVVFGNLSKDYVMNRIIPVHPKSAVNGRRPIKVQLKPEHKGKVYFQDTNLLLMLVTIPNKENLYPPVPELISSTDLEYIGHVLLEIAKEEVEDNIKSLGMNHPSSVGVKNEEASDNSSEDDSISIRRNFSDENFFYKMNRTQNWVDHNQNTDMVIKKNHSSSESFDDV